MDNQVFLNQMKIYYESLRYFNIENNHLILNIDDNIYKIPFTNVDLTMISPNLFYIDPKELFHILYMLELLPKKELNQTECEFIKSYVNRYLFLNDNALEDNKVNKELLWGISTPIYSSYDPTRVINPAAIIIQNTIANHSEKIESGRGNQQRLVLTKNDAFAMIDEDPTPTDFAKSGFTTLALIFTAAASTIMYILNFIIGK